MSFIDKNDAENGDKIFLPPSALDRLGKSHLTLLKHKCQLPASTLAKGRTVPLQRCVEHSSRMCTCEWQLKWVCACWLAASLHIEYPMLFKVENPKEGQITHCGVLEFIAEEGLLYMPYWVCNPCSNLCLNILVSFAGIWSCLL